MDAEVCSGLSSVTPEDSHAILVTNWRPPSTPWRFTVSGVSGVTGESEESGDSSAMG